MREIKFQGALTPSSFKQFFLIYDSLLPLEWRINYKHYSYIDISLLDKYFDRIICREKIMYLNSWYKRNSKYMYMSLKLSFDWYKELKEIEKYNFKGIDEIWLPINIIENDKNVLTFLLNCRENIRRIDIQIPTHDYVIDKSIIMYERLFNERDTQFFIISLYDSYEETSWYSKPSYEGLVDPLPEPYVENGNTYSIASDALFVKDGFFLNCQDHSKDVRIKHIGFDPYLLIYDMLNSKLEYYCYCSERIKYKEGNIYWEYFNWVANNIKINMDYTFIPNFILKPDSRYYKALIEDGYFIETKSGLLKKESNNVVSIIEIIE